jgi:hypothetical protein
MRIVMLVPLRWLLRTRFCFKTSVVLAVTRFGSQGLHNEDGNKRQSYGHAVAYDPWGDMVRLAPQSSERRGAVIARSVGRCCGMQ